MVLFYNIILRSDLFYFKIDKVKLDYQNGMSIMMTLKK